ncbi:hypothetical protein [Pelagerythrobacter sp.]|uniref:hypothetical protein n=1 Tax=Pelagerythrobacter sp. TaxID=2800702 RepID=UPI0035B16F04
MRRSLVLTDETARHPFRASLPPSARRLEPSDCDPGGEWRITLTDMRGFASAYVSCVIAITAFII